MFKINTNAMVTVTLTDAGVDQWFKHWSESGMRPHQWPALPADRVYRTALWNLMHVFGPVTTVGHAVPFERNEIVVGSGDCVTVETEPC